MGKKKQTKNKKIISVKIELPLLPPNVEEAIYRILEDIDTDLNTKDHGDRYWRYDFDKRPTQHHPLATKNDATKLDLDLIYRIAEYCSQWVIDKSKHNSAPALMTPYKQQIASLELFYEPVPANKKHIRDSVGSLSELLCSRNQSNQAKLIFRASRVFCDVLRFALGDNKNEEYVEQMKTITFKAIGELNWGISIPDEKIKRHKELLSFSILQMLEDEKRGNRVSDRLRVAHRIGVLFCTENPAEGTPYGQPDFVTLNDRFRKRKKLFKQHVTNHLKAVGSSPEQKNFVVMADSRFHGKAKAPPYSTQIPIRYFKISGVKRRRK